MLITPYGDKLINLIVDGAEVDELREEAERFPSIQLSERSVCDLELLSTGAFSPLDRFMDSENYGHVLEEMRLSRGEIFPIPITLPVEPDAPIKLDSKITLRNSKNELLAVMTIDDIYSWDRKEVSEKVFGTQDVRHPLVAEMHRWGSLNISGQLKVLQIPGRYDFQSLRLTPIQTRARLEKLGHSNVVAFQTRNPLHRAHEELTKRAIQAVEGILLLHPVVGMTKPGDIDHYTRVRTYKVLADNHYAQGKILLALLPLAMRLAGPREALWHALIRRNYGANNLIVGRHHASPGLDSQGKPFYGPYDAQELVEQFKNELQMGMVPFRELVYLPGEDRYEETSKVSDKQETISISGTQIREEYFQKGKQLPDWFTRPEVAEILVDANPPRFQQGVCIWFTGLSAAGKSTTAEILTVLLLEQGRQVTVLDGDVVRTHLSKGLGFSRVDRDDNIRRIGFVASELVRHRGTVVCAAISPYKTTRNDVRNMVGQDRFVEVFVDTPLEECERRDVKGLYARARSGDLKGFTGIDDPYETPDNPEIVLDTILCTPEENARKIIKYLAQEQFIREDESV